MVNSWVYLLFLVQSTQTYVPRQVLIVQDSSYTRLVSNSTNKDGIARLHRRLIRISFRKGQLSDFCAIYRISHKKGIPLYVIHTTTRYNRRRVERVCVNKSEKKRRVLLLLHLKMRCGQIIIPTTNAKMLRQVLFYACLSV